MVLGVVLAESCVLANFAAGVVVSKVGCVPCSVDELKSYIRDHEIESSESGADSTNLKIKAALAKASPGGETAQTVLLTPYEFRSDH